MDLTRFGKNISFYRCEKKLDDYGQLDSHFRIKLMGDVGLEVPRIIWLWIDEQIFHANYYANTNYRFHVSTGLLLHSARESFDVEAKTFLELYNTCYTYSQSLIFK